VKRNVRLGHEPSKGKKGTCQIHLWGAYSGVEKVRGNTRRRGQKKEMKDQNSGRGRIQTTKKKKRLNVKGTIY